MVSDGIYVIQPLPAYHAGLALDVPSAGPNPPASWGNQVVIQQWILHQGPNQKWEISNDGFGYYTIVSAYSNKALDVPWGLPQPQPIQQYQLHGLDNQLWGLETFPEAGGSASRPEHHIISNKASGLVLDIPSGSLQVGVQLQQYPRHGGWNQRFVLWER